MIADELIKPSGDPEEKYYIFRNDSTPSLPQMYYFDLYLARKSLSITFVRALANVKLFVGVTRRLHPLVGEHPMSMSTSFVHVSRVVCESTPIIQLSSYLLDKNLSIIFVGAIVYYRSRKCNTCRRGHPTASSIRRRSSDEYVNFIFRSSCL